MSSATYYPNQSSWSYPAITRRPQARGTLVYGKVYSDNRTGELLHIPVTNLGFILAEQMQPHVHRDASSQRALSKQLGTLTKKQHGTPHLCQIINVPP